MSRGFRPLQRLFPSGYEAADDEERCGSILGCEHVENGYRDLVWPWPAVEAPPLDMTAEWTREELLGYVATWSATARLVKTQGPAKYDALGAALARVWPDGERRTIRWPLTIKLARRQ